MRKKNRKKIMKPFEIDPKERHLYYFRGSPREPGSSSKELREPTFERPFFVADNPKGAWSYAVGYADSDNPSIFVLKTKEPLAKIAFSFRNKPHLEALRKKFPKLVEFIEFLREGHLTYGKGSFWDCSMKLVDEFYNFGRNGGKDFDKLTDKQKMVLDVLMEVGLVKYSDKITILDPKFKDGLDKHWETPISRRILKSKVYETIQSMGYNVIMDDDITLTGIEGNEYAVLDKSVFVGGYDKSFGLDDLEEFVFGKKIDWRT